MAPLAGPQEGAPVFANPGQSGKANACIFANCVRTRAVESETWLLGSAGTLLGSAVTQPEKEELPDTHLCQGFRSSRANF